MSSLSTDVLSALRRVRYPGFSRDIVSFGIVRDVKSQAGKTVVTLAPPADSPDLIERIRPEIERELASIDGIGDFSLEIVEPAAGSRSVQVDLKNSSPRGPQGIPQVRNIIAVASGKGGVGKSTVAANLAVALREHGSIGLLDADVYGPSVPILLGVEEAEPHVSAERRIEPIRAHGIVAVSMGHFVARGEAVIWRGPMVTKLVVEFLRNVDWGALDYLVLDLPPGTGDVQLTLAQQLRMTGGVIVTTPQDVALADVRRGVRMFTQVKVPVLGVIENMSGLVCSHCGHGTDVFGSGGGERMAAELGIDFLGSIPLAPLLSQASDAGAPLVASNPEHPVSQRLREIAAAVAERAERVPTESAAG